MSGLDELLQTFVPPAVPPGLAQRAADGAATHQQKAAIADPRRRDRRGGWKRPLWIGAASFGLAFTSAVAATVVSGGRIDIPVVKQVVQAIPVLENARRDNEAPRLAKMENPKAAAPIAQPPAAAAATPPQPDQPGWRKARVMQRLEGARQQVEVRRAAGLPTPRADRIERQAKAIVERREAAGLPTPSIEEVEAGLALGEMRRMSLMRRGGRFDPAMLTDQQLARIASRLAPERRERFQALPPDMQRELVARTIEKIRARRNLRPAVPADDVSSEGISEPLR